MSVKFITWKEFYSVGCRELDDQHKQILEIINDLYSLLQSNEAEPVAVEGLLDRLVQYVVDHFQCEEEWMKESGYPELAEHKSHHERLSEKTLALCHRIDADTGHELLGFLKQWWVDHICGADKQYSAYMKPVHTG